MIQIGADHTGPIFYLSQKMDFTASLKDVSDIISFINASVSEHGYFVLVDENTKLDDKIINELKSKHFYISEEDKLLFINISYRKILRKKSELFSKKIIERPKDVFSLFKELT